MCVLCSYHMREGGRGGRREGGREGGRGVEIVCSLQPSSERRGGKRWREGRREGEKGRSQERRRGGREMWSVRRRE